MIETIRAVIEGIRGSVSEGYANETGRYAGAILLVVLLIAMSGYMAAAGGVSVDFSLGTPETGADDGDLRAVHSERGDGNERRAESSGGAPGAGADADAPTDGDALETAVLDPDVTDTDGDGIPDVMERQCTKSYPDADPLRQDVYVEVDSVDGVALSEESVATLERAFADAPVENPGDSGVAIHFIRSDGDLPQGQSVNDDARPGEYNDVEDYRENHFQHAPAGYHYLLVSTEVAYKGEEYYAGAGEPGTAIVESYDRDGIMASLVLHELGHSFGLDRSDEGVDAREYSQTAYQSVMNYNALYEMTTYSDGEDEVGRNEWRYVAENRHQPTIETGADGCPAIP